MKTVAVRWVVALVTLVAASFAFAGPVKSKIISSTSSPLMINVPDEHFLKITNFSQVGGTDRAVVSVMLTGDENSGRTNVLTATRTDLSTGAGSQNPPEISNRVVIAGPAEVMIAPVTGATLFITYKKEFDEGGGGGGGSNIVFLTPTPFPFVSPTPFPFITPSPTPTPST